MAAGGWPARGRGRRRRHGGGRRDAFRVADGFVVGELLICELSRQLDLWRRGSGQIHSAGPVVFEEIPPALAH
jgi:hypothetical protein